MDTANIPTDIVQKPPPLNSDQLNYLIWRYLQEAGYGDAAVNLQRDWKVDAENLPFAKHIKGQALVSLVQKGLRYHHLSLTVDENGQSSRPLNPSMYFFGPESARASSPIQKESLIRNAEIERTVSPASTTATLPKKMAREIPQIIPTDLNPQSAKRGRRPQFNLSDRNGSTTRKTSGPAAMDVDSVIGHLIPSRDFRSPSIGVHTHDDGGQLTNGALDERMDVDEDASSGVGPIDPVLAREIEDIPPPIVPTLTHGESRAIQVAPAKIESLTPSTAILSVDDASSITQTMWRPGESSILTANGEHLCGIWRLDGQELRPDSVNSPPQRLFASHDTSLITAAAWEPTGSLLAVATYSEQEGQIHLFDGQELCLMETLPASQRTITSLRWQPAGLRLLGIAAYDEQISDGSAASTIMSWDLSRGSSASTPLSLTVSKSLLDVDCIMHNEASIICAAGDGIIYHCRVSSTELVVENTWSSGDEAWTFVRCSSRGNEQVLLVAASADSCRIWLPAKNTIKHDAHAAAITGLEIRPSSPLNSGTITSAEFATSSMDGTIKLWHVNSSSSIECIQKLRIGSSSPVMSISYSPDGFCLAGASYGSAQIWNTEHGYNLMATWQGTEPEWQGASLQEDDLISAGGVSSINGDNGTSSVDHSLAWHNDSKKLAYGLGSQVAVIDFQR